MNLKASSTTTIAILAVYFLLTLAVGYFTRKKAGSSSQFLHAKKDLPGSVAAIAFLAANCGALEVVGVVAASAKYGALALHFYWIGAIPAMVFLALFMMPIYSKSRARTVPEFLHMRYGPRVRLLNAVSQILIMVFVAGISLYAIASMLNVFIGWSFLLTAVLTSAIVFCYVSLGGLPATIYNGLVQFAITLIGLAPLSYLLIRNFHGPRGLWAALPESMKHTWIHLAWSNPRGASMDVLGLTAGLGFVLGFGYWCTDFILMQRAFAARTREAAINTPLLAAYGKLAFSVLVVVPGLAASVLFHGQIENFDHVLPSLMLQEYGPVLLGLGVAGILASLMSALAGNIAAFSTVWTHDIYRAHLQPHRDDRHYVTIGRIAAAIAAFLSIGTGYLAFRYKNLMDYLQLVFALFSAPLFATLILGMFTTWATPTGAFWGLICGMTVAILHHLACHFSLISYGSQMSADFYGAIYGFVASGAVTVGVSLLTEPKPLAELEGVTYQREGGFWKEIPRTSLVLAACLLGICMLLNYLFR